MLRGEIAKFMLAVALPIRTKDPIIVETKAMDLGNKMVEVEGRHQV